MRFLQNYILLLLFTMCAYTSLAQDKFVLTNISKSNPNQVRVKWYSQAFLYPEGVNLYRKESAEANWTKLNTTPLKKGNYTPTPEEFKQDKELKNYVDIVNSFTKLEGVPLLGAYVKSFKSEAFSKYLGIAFIDNTISNGKSVQYKVGVLKNGSETELAISETITTGIATISEPPKEIAIVAKNKKTSIKWLPETSRYYSVNIYRMFDSLGSDRKLVNKDPIIVSKNKNKEGILEYPEQFYIDEKLKEDTTYFYSFTTINFFGEESEFGKPIRVFIKDVNAPEAPVFISQKVTQKKVKLVWRKTKLEKDFIGFHIYRAFKSQKEYTQANKQLLAKTDTTFTDEPIKYGPYRYVVAAIDRSGNEGVAEEIPIETIDEEPPAIPKNLVIKSDTGRISLTWDKNTESDLMGYLVYQTINKNTSDDGYVLITPKPLPTNVFKQGLAKNSKNKFLYKVVAIDSTYNKSELSEYAVTTLPDVVAPSEPFINNCSLNEKKQIVIEFFKNTELDLKGYDLYRVYTNDAEEKTEKVNAKLIDKTAMRFIDREYEGEGLVKYYLIALDSSNHESKKSNTVKLNIKKEVEKVNYAFKDFNAKAQRLPNTWKLKWKLNTEEELFYVVYTRNEGDANFEPQTKNLEDPKCTLTTTRKAKVYVQVRAYNASGLQAKSEIKLLDNTK